VQAETLIQAAERQGLSTASLEWPGTIPARSAGPIVDFRTFYSTRGVLLKRDPPAHQPDIARRLGVSDQRTELPAAIGWQNVPESRLPPCEATVAVRSTRPQENTDRLYNVYVYATSNAGYDRALIAEGKDGGAPLCKLAAGQWAEIRVVLEGGRRAGLHFKLIELAPDLSQFWLYFTSISRARAHPTELEDLLASPAFPVPETADHGPIEAGLIDAGTYVEQGLMFFECAERVYRHVVETYRPDVLLAGSPVTDEFSHQFMALVTPAYPGYNAAIAPLYAGYLRQAYVGADRLLGVLVDLFPEDTIVAVSSDHGFGAAWRSVNANLVLAQADLLTFDVEGKPAPDSKAVAYWAGGTCNIYINLAGREPGGLVPPRDYEPVRQTIVDAFEALNSGAAEGGKVTERIYRLEQTRTIQTSCGSVRCSRPIAGHVGLALVGSAWLPAGHHRRNIERKYAAAVRDRGSGGARWSAHRRSARHRHRPDDRRASRHRPSRTSRWTVGPRRGQWLSSPRPQPSATALVKDEFDVGAGLQEADVMPPAANATNTRAERDSRPQIVEP